MTVQKATAQMVQQAADAILATGTWPSSHDIRARIGGGSLSTIQRYLDQWRADTAQRVLSSKTQPEAPAEVRRLFEKLWTTAVQRAADPEETP